jgi:hypothetical protein
MIMDDKAKVIRLTADNLTRGVISFRDPRDNDDAYTLRQYQHDFNQTIILWLREDEKDFLSAQQKEDTDALYEKIITYRTNKFIVGELQDKDLDAELKELKKELLECETKKSEFYQDNIRMARELKDKTDLIDQYEQTLGKRK